jgi:hypothetical protein
MDLSLDFGKVTDNNKLVDTSMNLRTKVQRLAPINFGNYIRRSPMSQLNKRRKPIEDIRYQPMKKLILPDA